MANKRAAKTLAKHLNAIDSLIDQCIQNDQLDRIDALIAQKRDHIARALELGVKLVHIPVADGYSLYYEARRTSKLATFEWLHGGGDIYISPWGYVISVPLEAADRLIRLFHPKYVD